MSWVCHGRIEGGLSLASPSGGLQDGAAGEAARDPAPVLGGAVKIIQEIYPAIDQVGCGRDSVIIQPLATQCRLRFLGTPGDRRGSRDPDTNILDRALAGEDHHSADTDNGVSRRLVGQFLIAPSVPFYRQRNLDLGKNLVRLQCGRQEIEKELPRRNSPLTLASSGDDHRVEGKDRRWIVSGRIGVYEGAADRSPVANLPIADACRRVREQRNRGPNLGVSRDLMVRHQRADHDLAIGSPYAAQLGYAPNVDQRFGVRQTQL